MVSTFARPLRPTTLTWRIGTSGTPCACLCVAGQRAGTVGTLFRRIAMLTKPFLQVFCMVGSSFGAWLAATSTAWWICTCGTPCACLCVLRQGAATVHTFSLAVLAIPVGFLLGMVGCLLGAWLPTASTARRKCTGNAPSPWSCICMQGVRTLCAGLGCPRLLSYAAAAHAGLGCCTVVHQVGHTDGFVAIAAQTLFCLCCHWGDSTLLAACSSEFFGFFFFVRFLPG